MIFFISFWLFLIFLILEIFITGSILFLSIALSFLAVACASLFSLNLLILFLTWILTFFSTAHLIYLFLKQRKLSKTENLTGDTNIIGMIGQSCKIISLMPDRLYLVRYEFEEWTAESHDDDLLEIEEIVRIVRIIGNRIIIKKI